MEGGAVRHNFERDPPRNHPCQVWFNLVQQFQRRRLKCDLLSKYAIICIIGINRLKEKFLQKNPKYNGGFRGEDLNVIFNQNMPNLHNRYKSAERKFHRKNRNICYTTPSHVAAVKI